MIALLSLGKRRPSPPIPPWAFALALVPDESFSDRFGALVQQALAVWNYQLTSIDGRPMTVGKVTIALLVLTLGLPVARLVTRRIAHRLFKRIGMELGAAAAFETLAFYVVVVGLGLFALWVAEIPLTVFTLAGGALAIGIGFGSQNILNNFISGLIILVERPIKVGDLIEVGETFGRVENIGARSTEVKNSDNFHIIIPNSAFLENNVINWTHEDNLVRISLSVGVAYGSPTKRVEELLLQAIAEHPRTVSPPEPMVLFDEFGDNSLCFNALFWIKMQRHMDRRRALSDVRHRVDELFHQDAIVIAFPQRDVHLDSLSPLTVRLEADDHFDSSTTSRGSSGE